MTREEMLETLRHTGGGTLGHGAPAPAANAAPGKYVVNADDILPLPTMNVANPNERPVHPPSDDRTLPLPRM
jgi:hypothetical protein